MIWYEFRLWKQDTKWEDIDPVVIGSFPGKTEALSFAGFLSAANGTEVRFNQEGSTQGHYVGTERKFAQLYPCSNYEQEDKVDGYHGTVRQVFGQHRVAEQPQVGDQVRVWLREGYYTDSPVVEGTLRASGENGIMVIPPDSYVGGDGYINLEWVMIGYIEKA